MAGTTTADFAQYAGELFMFGNTNTPFLAALGSSARVTTNFDFALSSSYTLASGTQESVTESESMASPTSFESYSRDQDVNSCQIVQKYVRTSYKMLSSWNKLIGNSSDYGSIDGPNSIADVHEHNLQAALKEIYKDLNYTCWNGTYQRAGNATTAGLSRGLDSAISTYSTSAGVAMGSLTKAKIDGHLADCADAGVDMSGVVIWVGSEAKIKLSDLYSLNLQTQPRDRQVGGVDVQVLVTDFGMFPIVYDADIPSKHIFFINMPFVRNVWCPTPGKGNLFYEEKSDDAAAKTGMLYGQWGLDYGAEEMHSVITTT